MRVANIIEEGRLGGPQVRIIRVAEKLKESVNTTVIMPEENSHVFRDLCEKSHISYKVFRLSRITKEAKVALRYITCSLFELWQLTRYLRKEHFDLIHISGGAWQYKGLIAGKLSGTKTVWHLNDTQMPLFVRKLFSFLSPFADGYIFASNRSKKYYKPFIRKQKPSFVVPAPVDTDLFTPEISQLYRDDTVDKWADETVIGTVANINPIKGLEVFIKVASMLNKKFNKLRFVVVGPVYESQKSYYKSLRQLCENLKVDNVEFVGSKKDVRPFLKRFDIYLCTSYAESSPISVWEAMSMGTAIVSTDVGDVSRYVQPGKVGEIARTGDCADISSKVICLINDKTKREYYQSESRKVAITSLDIRLAAAGHLEAYRTISKSL